MKIKLNFVQQSGEHCSTTTDDYASVAEACRFVHAACDTNDLISFKGHNGDAETALIISTRHIQSVLLEEVK